VGGKETRGWGRSTVWGEAPVLIRVSLAPSLHALTLVVQTKVRKSGDGGGVGWE
jgi:hypothetical protein